MNRVLVIGSEGFIGNYCVRFYLEKGYNVSGCDLIDYPKESYTYFKLSRLQPSFDEVFAHQTYDVCINAAGNGSVPVSIEHPLTDFEANCGDVIRLLEFIRNSNRQCKYLHLSSAAVYGNPVSLPIYETASLQPLSPYGWHKLISEKLCEEYSVLHQLAIAVVRPFSVYGPGLRKQLIWDMAQKAKAAGPQKKVELWGDGTESRDFIYINDLVAAIDAVLTCTEPGSYQVYNFASGTETTIRQVAEAFYYLIDPEIKIEFNNKSRPGDPKNWRADISKLSAIGFVPEYSISDGLKQTAEWIKK